MMTMLLLLAVPGSVARAQPPARSIGKTVADSDSPHYRFERFTLSSPDASRSWRVHVAIPKSAAPAQGYPAFWMLDGNASLMALDDALLTELAAKPAPPVLVFVGHDNDLQFDTPGRHRDYTPALTPPPSAEGEGARPPQLTGGADAFLDLIERQVRPRVQALAPLDPARQTLWGHSFGGVFVLHTLFTRTGAFTSYVAASPSMWFGDGYLAHEADRFLAHNAGRPARVAIHVGESEREGAASGNRRDPNDPRVRARLEQLKAAPPDAAKTLAERLQSAPGLTVTYREFPGLAHGPTFAASLRAALLDSASTP
jgi:predicted alpha/beta superfamily hydrolase